MQTSPRPYSPGVTGPLAAASGTPVGPIAAAMGNAITGFARKFDASGDNPMVSFPGGGAARIETCGRSRRNRRQGPRFRRRRRNLLLARRGLRVDGLIETSGGGPSHGERPAAPAARRRRNERPGALRARTRSARRASPSIRSASRRALTERRISARPPLSTVPSPMAASRRFTCRSTAGSVRAATSLQVAAAWSRAGASFNTAI